MKSTLSIFFLLTTLILNSIAPSNELTEGTWLIDLRPTPESKPYYQKFKVESISDFKIEGTFYGSPLKNSLLNKKWDKDYFAFETADKNHTYYHSGYVENNQLHGISYCPTRNLMIPWSGFRTTN
ncbi:MAG: hypothetical protein CMB99_05260 [Flavobacteriaceae bacterium]|nr:hypothetical protein [Flavobacteriaceae bacterium]|tara:strand:+ start:49422 stop:49796 length:375 start_codon:yes stop_codon:yes gene_type:complete